MALGLRKIGWLGGAIAGVLVTASIANAFVIDAKTDAQKERRDIAKQVSKYTLCLVKAIQKCESGGGTSAVECHADTGAVDYAGDMTLDPKNKQPAAFQASLAKCDSKVNLAKKGNLYTEIGCPGDCNPSAAGTQQCADLAAFQATVVGNAAGSAKAQLGTLAIAVDAACGVDTGLAQTAQGRIDCTVQNATTLSSYAKGLGKCQDKCENDYKDKKGNGGPNDLPVCNAGSPLAASAFSACDAAVLSKAQSKHGSLSPTNLSLVLPAVRTAVNNALDGQYDKNNPGEEPDTNVCGNCGNGTREGAEECDGADNAFCGGPACNADCTCPVACGNDIRQGNEECDGTDDQACPGSCTGTCTCP